MFSVGTISLDISESTLITIRMTFYSHFPFFQGTLIK